MNQVERLELIHFFALKLANITNIKYDVTFHTLSPWLKHAVNKAWASTVCSLRDLGVGDHELGL